MPNLKRKCCCDREEVWGTVPSGVQIEISSSNYPSSMTKASFYRVSPAIWTLDQRVVTYSFDQFRHWYYRTFSYPDQGCGAASTVNLDRVDQVGSMGFKFTTTNVPDFNDRIAVQVDWGGGYPVTLTGYQRRIPGTSANYWNYMGWNEFFPNGTAPAYEQVKAGWGLPNDFPASGDHLILANNGVLGTTNCDSGSDSGTHLFARKDVLYASSFLNYFSVEWRIRRSVDTNSAYGPKEWVDRWNVGGQIPITITALWLQ